MPKLHEILAVENDLGATMNKLLEEKRNLFASKTDRFMGYNTTTTFIADNRQSENKEDYHEIVTTVPESLQYLVNPIAKYLDVDLQKNRTNQEAVADLVVEGNILAKNLPATFLLGLENHLKRVRSVYQEIPTLKPGVRWTPSETVDHVYETQNPDTFKTEKTPMVKSLAAATASHPEQVHVWNEDRPVARIVKTESSGMMKPMDKSKLLARIDLLMHGVKQARQRANSVEVVQGKIGKVLMDYINDVDV